MGIFRKSPPPTQNRRVRPTPVEKSESGPAPTDVLSDDPAAPAGNGRSRRILRELGRFLTLALLLAVFIYVGWLAYRFATTAKTFAIAYIDISGNEQLSNEAVLTAAGVEMGKNIFAQDLEKTRQQLLANPWVQQAHVFQKLPATLVLDVVERSPVLLVLFEVPYLVDEEGNIFKRWKKGDPTPGTILTGIERTALRQDPEGVQNTILDSIALIERYQKSGMSRISTLHEINAALDGGFSLTIGKPPVYVRMGKPPYAVKFARLGKLLRRLQAENKEAVEIFFDNPKRPDRITVKLKTPQDDPSDQPR